MTAGSGIIHQEMPKGDPTGRMHGFQLWANLPAALKMTAPRYQEVKTGDIPEITDDDGTHVRIVCGNFWGKTGPVDGIAADPIYLDVSVPPGKRKTLPVETTRHAFAYVFAGIGKVLQRLGSARGADRRRRMGRHRRLRPTPTIARWFFSTAATKSRCRPAKTEFVFCWSPASRWKSRWRGTVRS